LFCKIETLKVFCDLSETESFTKAAQINQVTQSAPARFQTNSESWTTLTNVPAIVDLQNAVTNPISDGAKFYRLKK